MTKNTKWDSPYSPQNLRQGGYDRLIPPRGVAAIIDDLGMVVAVCAAVFLFLQLLLFSAKIFLFAFSYNEMQGRFSVIKTSSRVNIKVKQRVI